MEHRPTDDSRQTALPPAGGSGGVSVLVAGVLVAVVGTGTALLTARWLLMDQVPAAAATSPEEAAVVPKVQLFQGWQRPELALVLSAQQHGYLLPCGCSRPQVGGLERRYNFVQQLKDRGWPVMALDLGDIPQRHGPQNGPNVQRLIKYRYSMTALDRIGYTAVGFGEYEMAVPLEEALAAYALNFPTPKVLAGNLKDAAEVFPDCTHPWAAVKAPNSEIKVGVVSMVGPTVQKKVNDHKVQFEAVPAKLPQVLQQLQEKEKPDFRVLLYQGTMKEARTCAGVIKDFHVILCLTDEDEPSAWPERVGETLVIGVGHKGKNVGVVGVFPTGNPMRPFDLKYQLVALREEYLTPPGQEKDHPILKLMEEYTRELKRDDYLGRYPQVKHVHQLSNAKATYVGSDVCRKCHADAYKVWKQSAHAHAYDTLEKATKPSLRQFDGECVVCHVTGFGFEGGFTKADRTAHLKHVGCESCHGPASEHVKNPANAEWHKLLNPWKAPENEDAAGKAKRQFLIDQACQKCHDPDNDVHWNFGTKWPKVEHATPLQ